MSASICTGCSRAVSPTDDRCPGCGALACVDCTIGSDGQRLVPRIHRPEDHKRAAQRAGRVIA